MSLRSQSRTSPLLDIAPPFWQPTSARCTNDGRRCGGGDSACRAKAQADGYTVAIGNYQLCRPADTSVEVRESGWILIALLVLAIVGAGVALVLRARAKRA